MKEIGPIEVGEIKTVWFDFSSEKPATATLASAAITVTVLQGTDASPTNVKLGPAAVNGNYVTQQVRPGVVGCRYKLVALATDSDGNIHRVVTQLRVIP